MPIKLTDIIYGKQKNINLEKYNPGSVRKAIAFDLKEFGERGVQGVSVKDKVCLSMVSRHKKDKEKLKLKEPYVMAGLFQKDLVLVIRDRKNEKFGAMSELIKDYKGLKKKLAKSDAAVVNIGEDTGTQSERDIITNASKAKAGKYKTKVQKKDDPDFGGITGIVLLCAHGTPKIKPGRVIGTHLAGKKPSEICDIFTMNKDVKKRIAKDFNGKIILSGCFTGSGGPEKDKQDDPFAMKVKAELKKRGYKKLSVEGMPGPSITADSKSKDGYGKTMKPGDEAVIVRGNRMLEALEKRLVKVCGEIEMITDKILKKHPSFNGNLGSFEEIPGMKTILKKVSDKEKVMESIRKEIEKLSKDIEKFGKKDGKDAKKDGRSMKGFKGTFGVRLIKQKLNL